MAETKHYKDVAIQYAHDVVDRRVIIGEDVVHACQRFLRDLERDDIELRMHDPDLVINIISKTVVHKQGEDLDGHPLQGKPLELQPFQVFIIVNLFGWFYTGTDKRRFQEAFIMMGRKNGKAVSCNTDIPTPDGWMKMADIHPGDTVFGRDGSPTTVLAESEIFMKPMYRVTFEDGSTVKASGDHIWTVQTKKSREAFRRTITHPEHATCIEARENNGWITRTTEQMASDFARTRPDKKGTEYKYRVPMNGPVAYPEADLPIDPYTFGVWLGDGSSGYPVVTCGNQDIDEMVAFLKAEGHSCTIHSHPNRASSIGIDTGTHPAPANSNQFLNKLREIGVLNCKHIPDVYLHASIEQRTALLQGLMDTDGTCSKAGQCSFTQKSKILSYQVLELIRSLGIKATITEKKAKIYGKECGVVYEIRFWTTKNNSCFRLKRKTARLKEKLAPRMDAKSIVDISPIPVEPSKCIYVDAPDHLYLCDRSYTVTHNTSLVASLAWAAGILQRHSGSRIYVVANALKQALESFNFIRFSDSHILC